MFNAQRRLHHREAARLMQYIPAACSTSEWPAGGVNPKPPKTSLQAVVDAESRPSIPRWGKRSPPPPGRRRGLCTPYPGRYLWLSLISHLLSLWHAAGSSPQNNMAFLFCILSRYSSPTHRASHWPPRVLPPHPITLTPSSIPPDASRVSRRWSPFNSRSSPTPRSVRCFPIRMAQTSPVIGGF